MNTWFIILSLNFDMLRNEWITIGIKLLSNNKVIMLRESSTLRRIRIKVSAWIVNEQQRRFLKLREMLSQLCKRTNIFTFLKANMKLNYTTSMITICNLWRFLILARDKYETFPLVFVLVR